MNYTAERLRVKLKRMQGSAQFNSSNKYVIDNHKLEIHVFLDDYTNNNLGLAEFIAEHIERRGFEDAVELNIVNVHSDRHMESFVIIGNQVIKDLDRNEIIEILNVELDRILYNALGTAKRDALLSSVS